MIAHWTTPIVALLVAALGCRAPAPQPPGECPARVSAAEFRAAVFTVYRAALSPLPAESGSIPRLAEATLTIRCGVPLYGEFWRRLALARLAARSTTDEFVLAALRVLTGPELVGIVGLLESGLAEIQGQRERFAEAYRITVPTESIGQKGMPTCESTPPDTTHGAQGWLATAVSSVWLRTTLMQVARQVDPQAWSTGCGRLVFRDSHVAKRTASGQFDVDPNTCLAKPGTSYTLGTRWRDELFEHFLPMTYSPSFFKNVLSVDVSEAPPGKAYKMTYALNTGLQAAIGGVSLPCGTSGLYLDEGGITAVDDGAGWEYVVASKQLTFTETIASPDLVKDTAIALHALMDMMPWLVCCPNDFP